MIVQMSQLKGLIIHWCYPCSYSCCFAYSVLKYSLLCFDIIKSIQVRDSSFNHLNPSLHLSNVDPNLFLFYQLQDFSTVNRQTFLYVYANDIWFQGVLGVNVELLHYYGLGDEKSVRNYILFEKITRKTKHQH